MANNGLPRWWSKRGQEDQFDDLSADELVEIDLHGLMEDELPAYLRAIRRVFGDAAYELMVGQGLPEEAEEWLEEAFPNGDRLYSFLQCLGNNPFCLASDSDSDEESGSGDEQGSDEGGADDEGPKNSPNPPPPPPSADNMEA